MKPKIFFFVPVFNEQETVGILLYRISEMMKALHYDYQVILVLDGCTDESPDVAAPYLSVMSLRVIDHETRRGYGASLNEVIQIVLQECENQKRDFFMIIDGDFSNDPSYLDEMSQQIERNVDLYSGNRLASSAVPPATKRLAQWLARKVLGLRGLLPPVEIDFLTTFRGCRVHLLKRAERELAGLSELGPNSPPQAAGLLFLLALLPLSRKFLEVPIVEKRIRRRSSRFSIIRFLRFLAFTHLLPAGSRRAAAGSHAERARVQEKKAEPVRPEPKAAAAQKQQEQPAPSGTSKSSRRRRQRRRSHAGGTPEQQAAPAEHQRDRQKQRPQEQRGPRERKEQATHKPLEPREEQAGQPEISAATEQAGQRSRSRRRRRRSSNRRRQKPSNPSEQKES